MSERPFDSKMLAQIRIILMADDSLSVSLFPGKAYSDGRNDNFCRLPIEANVCNISIISCIFGGMKGCMLITFSLANFLPSAKWTDCCEFRNSIELECKLLLSLIPKLLLVLFVFSLVLFNIMLLTKFWQIISTGIWQCDMDKQFSLPQFEIILNMCVYDWLKSFMLRLSSLHELNDLRNDGVFRNTMSFKSRRQSCKFKYSNGCTSPLSSGKRRDRKKLNERSIFFSL